MDRLDIPPPPNKRKNPIIVTLKANTYKVNTHTHKLFDDVIDSIDKTYKYWALLHYNGLRLSIHVGHLPTRF